MKQQTLHLVNVTLWFNDGKDFRWQNIQSSSHYENFRLNF